MPTYDYKCTKCGITVEKFHRMADAPLLECSSCGGKLERLIGTGGGILFRGSGSRANDSPSCGGGGDRCDRSTPCCGRDTFCGGRHGDT